MYSKYIHFKSKNNVLGRFKIILGLLSELHETWHARYTCADDKKLSSHSPLYILPFVRIIFYTCFEWYNRPNMENQGSCTQTVTFHHYFSKFGLSQSNFYHYTCRFCIMFSRFFLTIQQGEHCFYYLVWHAPDSKHMVSQFFKVAWENEGGINLSVNLWSKILQRIILFQTLHRLQYTKAKLH